MMKEVFFNLISKHTTSHDSTENLWLEIEQNYSEKGRYYHNLQHIENMYSELELCKQMVSDWDTILFSLFYHDIIYDPVAKDNEEQSAKKAVYNLTVINYPIEKIDRCKNQILATKTHALTPDNDTCLFTDADLSILGAKWTYYKTYYQQIRKEYAIYPDIIYNPGRKKVLEHFLDMDFIFKTTYFRDKYELKAKENILKELREL